jgi:CubicO group peptidase (beta-lactamase class C family)
VVEWARAYEDFAGELIGRSQIPAAAVALARDGEVVYERGFGHRDAAGSLPVTPDTRFGLGSVTKSFPALAIAQLDEAGKLSTSDPVARWLPELTFPRDPGRAREVAIHHFLTHTSGIPPEPALLHARAASICADPDFPRLHPPPLGVPADVYDLERIATYEELMALMARQGWAALGPPGRVLSYSNEGYVLLAAIVERASDRPFPEYLQAHVLDPLGMTRTGLYTSETAPLEPEVVPFGLDSRDGKQEVFASPAWWDQGKMFGNGGLKSTTRDLLRYLEIYRTGGVSHSRRVLSAAGVARMTAPHAPIATGGHYGYGLQVGEAPGGLRTVGHGGGNKGVATQVVVVPERGLTAVALTNLANAPAAKLAQGLVNACLGLDPATPWATFPQHALEPGQLARFAGTYKSRPGVLVRVSARDGGLEIDLEGQSHRARPYADDAFLIEALEQPLCFLADHDGQVWGFAMGLRAHRKMG